MSALDTSSSQTDLLAELSSLPVKPPRSKLEVHRELIRELRRKGRTYREVSQLFEVKLGLHVCPSTLHSFIKVRAQHRKHHQFELPDPIVSTPASTSERLANLKAKAVPSTANRPRFEFHDNEALTLSRNGGAR